MIPKSTETKQQWKKIIHIPSLVLFHVVGQIILRTETGLINCFDTAYPVAVHVITGAVTIKIMTLNIVLSSGKIPHKVAPIHKSHLVAMEILQILACRGLVVTAALPSPIFIELRMLTGCIVTIHSWEQPRVILTIDELLLIRGSNITISTFLIFSTHILRVPTLCINRLSGSIVLAIEQRSVTILLTSKVGAHGNSVFRCILVERRIGVGSDYQEEESRIANYQHQKSKYGRVDYGLVLLFLGGIPKSPNNKCGKQKEEHNSTAVKRHMEHIHKEHIKCRVNIYYARNDTPKNECKQYN